MYICAIIIFILARSIRGHRGETYLGDQNAVTSADAHRDTLAVAVNCTGTNSENLSLVLLLDAALRKEDARGGLSLGLDTLDEHAVQERRKVLDAAEERLANPVYIRNSISHSAN